MAKFNQIFKCVFLITLLSLSIASCRKQNNKPDYGETGDVGASARDLLSKDHFNSLNIEIQTVGGTSPDPQTIAKLQTFLGDHLNKDSITVTNTTASSLGNSHVYSVTEIRQFEKDHRTVHSSGNQKGVYVLFLDGNSQDDSGSGKVLGQAYNNTSIVIFEKVVQSLSGSITQPSRVQLEATVLNHEFGHLLGLVNTGSAMQVNHQDAANGKHCTKSSCLMYWITDTSNVVNNLLSSGAIADLDQDCKNDLIANGGK